MKTWKKGAIMGFLLIPLLFLVCYPLMGIAAIFKAETMARIVDAIFMLPLVPIALIHYKLGIIGPSIPFYFTFIYLAAMFFWTLVGASIGYLIEKVQEVRS